MPKAAIIGRDIVFGKRSTGHTRQTATSPATKKRDRTNFMIWNGEYENWL